MKLRKILVCCFAAAALSGFAQTHAEGVEYYEADQLNNAKELLERNLNNPGTDKAVANYYLGMIALRENKVNDAAKYFDVGAMADPENPYNYIGLGQIALANGDPKVAEGNFKKAESLGKKDPAVLVALARAYDAVDPTTYAKNIDKYLAKARKDIDDPSVYIFEGDRLASQKDWGGAGAKYEMAINYDPNATAAYVKYANLFSQVNPQYAINMLKKLLALNPNSALGQRALANAYYNNNEYKEAASEYGKYVNNPNHFKQDEDRYSFLLFYGGNYKEGYDYATSLLKSNPNNFSAMRYQFMNAAQLPDMSDQLLPMAEKLWNTQQADPANLHFAPIDYILISQEFEKADKAAEAEKVLTAAIKEMPDNPNFYKELALVYVNLNDMPKACDAFDGYLKASKDPGYNDFIQAALYAYFAGVQVKADNMSEADKFFAAAADFANKAGKILPDNYKPLKILGDINIQKAAKEDIESAAQPLYAEAAKLLEASSDPSRYASDAKTIYNYLGNFYLSQNNKEEAKKYFNKYLEFDPDNADYRKFVESL